MKIEKLLETIESEIDAAEIRGVRECYVAIELGKLSITAEGELGKFGGGREMSLSKLIAEIPSETAMLAIRNIERGLKQLRKRLSAEST